jgi:hypothetical protein
MGGGVRMMQLSSFLGLGLSAIVLAGGCGVQGEAYEPLPVPAAKSVIYIYRPYSVAGSSSAPMITCGHESIELQPGGYHVFIEDGGPISCTTSTDASPVLQFDARAGGEYYIKEVIVSPLVDARARFSLVNTPTARREIAECRQQAAPEHALR